jgi:hypothetical protein
VEAERMRGLIAQGGGYLAPPSILRKRSWMSLICFCMSSSATSVR